jgi:hypothetical protein
MMSKLKNFFEVNFFFSTILVPAIALTLYCGSFAYICTRLHLEGVNYFFASKLGKYSLLLTLGAGIVFFVILILSKDNKLTFKYSHQRFYPDDLILLLLPLTPVVQYVLNNQVILSPAETLYIPAIFALFSCVYIFAIPALAGIFIPNRTLMALGLAFVFTVANMASISHYFSWFEVGKLRIQLIFLGGTFFLAWLLYNLNARWLLHLFILLNFVANSSAQILSQGANNPPLPVEENKLLALVENKTPAVTPNIYLLVYDAYVPNETMLGYGIDNSAQENYLHKKGFTFYPHTYSIGSATLETMTRVLNVSTEYISGRRTGVSGDGITQKILRSLGYKTYGLFPYDYMFRGTNSSYDYSFPESSIPPYIQLLKAIFMGEFRFDIEKVGFKEQPRAQFVETKQSIFKNVSGNKVFVYMHSDLPSHGQTSGACRSNETDLFKARLADANIEMRQDVNLIIENDPGAIVIIAGDHGPYLTKNCGQLSGVYDLQEVSRLDIQDRYGTFLAIRWPTGDFVEYDDIRVLQDIFPAVFAYLYKDKTILESKFDPIIPIPNRISGASVNNGVIRGGINDGELLFSSDK